MNILRIIYDWPPPWQGLAPHPFEITVAQAKKGHFIDVFCGRWPNAGPIETPKNTTMHPIMRELVPNSIFFTSSIILFFKYLKFRNQHHSDVIHSHGHFGIWIYAYRCFLRKHFPWASELKTPLVVHFHNTAQGRWAAFEESNKEIKPATKSIGWPMAVISDKYAVQAAAACIFVSQGNKEEAIKYYNADPTKCFVVETGANTDLFISADNEEKDKSRHDLGLDPYDKVVLNHGMMVERKNIHLIIEAIALLPSHYKLLLVGSGDKAYEGKLNEIILHKHLEDKIIKIGYTPYPQVPIAYQVSDLFVLPSSFEGLPKVVMQGLSCGVPCLVSGFKLQDDIRGLYYLDSLEPESIAKRIQEIIDNPVSVDTNKVYLNYSWDHRALEIEKIYAFAKKNYI